MVKVAFLDRDGVINHDTGYIDSIRRFSFVKNVFESLRKLQSRNFKLVIVTNQSGIARGYFTLTDLDAIHNYMMQKLESHEISIDSILVCPHYSKGIVSKYAKKCNCRKPKIGLMEQYSKNIFVDKMSSVFIGDKGTDMIAAHRFGLKNRILLSEYWWSIKSDTKFFNISPDIKSAIELVCRNE